MPVTFDVDPTKEPTANNKPGPGSIAGHLYLELQNNGGKIIKATDVGKDKYISTRFINGFVGACITAYNGHYHLEIGPDEVWVTITSSLSRYITTNAEKLRAVFVSHEGKMELNAVGGGNIYSADYSDLIGQLSEGIDKNTKGDIKDWIECSFSTTTPVSKIVSKVVLMAAMKEYITYKMSLECGLPKVTLRGTVEDWKEIRARVNKLREFNDKTLAAWSQVLALVLDRFVSAFTEKHVSTNFWNRVAHIEGGGSGPRYLEGWILAFVGFNDRGHYILKDFDHIRSTNDFGRMNTNDVPTATVQVPVTIDDNGVVHKTIFYAGPMLATFHENTISTALDWALVDVTEKS